MAYIITSQLKGEGLGALSQQAPDVHEALRKARQMHQTGMVNISIRDQAGHKIDGGDLLECIAGKKAITPDLKVQRPTKPKPKKLRRKKSN
jgi:hypothetical protein